MLALPWVSTRNFPTGWVGLGGLLGTGSQWTTIAYRAFKKLTNARYYGRLNCLFSTLQNIDNI